MSYPPQADQCLGTSGRPSCSANDIICLAGAPPIVASHLVFGLMLCEVIQRLREFV